MGPKLLHSGRVERVVQEPSVPAPVVQNELQHHMRQDSVLTSEYLVDVKCR